MARPKSETQLVEVKVRLRPETLAKLDLICVDPFTLKLQYGLRNQYLEEALADFFTKNFPERKGLSGTHPTILTTDEMGLDKLPVTP